MAHFAKIGINSKVIGVHAVDNKDLLNADGVEDESVGIEKTLNNITESISILVEKKLDLFSSTVNNK